jgi:predicted RNA-binding Zn-ribbon protein involved in translation (DUF1610 family)
MGDNGVVTFKEPPFKICKHCGAKIYTSQYKIKCPKCGKET